MPDLSTVTRRKAIRGTAPRWHRTTAGMCVVGAGVALIGLLATPRAQADSDPAYGDLSTLYQDAIAFDRSFDLSEELQFFSALGSLGDVLRASGVDLGDPFSSSATASDDLTAIEGEDAALTGQLTSLAADIHDYDNTPGLAAVDGKELSVVGDALTYEQQITADVDNLPTITAQDETNPLLISELSALYNNQIDFGNNLTNLVGELEIATPAGITDDNAALVASDLGILVDTQSATDTLTALADLSSVGI
jgi:hypothetical protein